MPISIGVPYVLLMLTFNAKGWSLRRLANAGKHIELQVGSQGLNQADCCGALTFTQWGGCNTAFIIRQHFNQLK